MMGKKKVLEMFDKSSGKWIRTVLDEGATKSDKTYMFDFVLAQIEVFTTMDEMEMGICTVVKN